MKETEDEGRQIYFPPKNERQLTTRAILAGCLLGGIVTCMNIYIGLKIGWSFGGSLMAAILSYAFFQVASPKKGLTVLETNIAQTAGSAAGSMASAAGLLAAIPALNMMGYVIPTWGLFVWSVSIAFLGVMFAVPLRRQYVVEEKLRFPTGLATANTIMAMYAESGESLKKARVLFYSAIFAFVFAVAAYFFHDMEKPPLHEWLNSDVLTVLASWGVLILVSPMMFGAGLIIGPRIGWSLVLGAFFGWGTGYVVQQTGWAPAENPMQIHNKVTGIWGARGWILWPGVAIMVSEALVSLALSYKTFINAFKGTVTSLEHAGDEKKKESIPNIWWQGGLAAASLLTIVTAWLVFDIPPYLSIIAIMLSAVLASVAVRSTGETDINPVGGMGKVTQGVFGLLTDSITTNLLAAGITGAGASQASDMMQDLKTGNMLGASPRKQFIAQLIGICFGVCFAVPVYLLFTSVWELGSMDSPLGAPAALAWKAVAEIMVNGFDALPPMSKPAVLMGLFIGALFPILRKIFPVAGKYVPSGLAFGISFLIPAYYAVAMFVGSMAYVIWIKKSPSTSEKYVFALSCGLIAGEGMAGIVNAVLALIIG